MRFAFIFKLALKNLWSHRLRSIVTITGVTIGVSSIIFLISLGYGLERLVTSQVADFEAFTIIDIPAANIQTLKIDQNTIEKIRKFGGISSVTSVTTLAGRIKKEDGSSTAETIITAANNDYWTLANTKIDKGSLPSNINDVVLNSSVLAMINESPETVIGKKIMLDVIIPPENREKPEDGLKVESNVELKVTGTVTDSKNPVVLIALSKLEQLGATKYTSLKVKVADKNAVPVIRKQIENSGFSTEYVGDTVNQIAQFFSLFRIILAAFGLIALIVAALGTFNTLTISLLERIREVGLFKALGMKNKDVYKIFLTESLFIGGAGGVFGLILGIFTGQMINAILYILADRAGVEKIGVSYTPVSFAIGVALFSLLVGFATGWYPSRRAVKIDPLDALRYE